MVYGRFYPTGSWSRWPILLKTFQQKLKSIIMAKNKKAPVGKTTRVKSKSDMIRDLNAKGKTTAEIRSTIEKKTGKVVYYSEISRALA